MTNNGAYGRQLGDAFRVGMAPAFVTRTLCNTEIAVTQIKCDLVDNALTAPVPRQDAFLVTVQISDLPKRELWVDGKEVRAEPLKAGTMSIFDLKRTWIGKRLAPFHAVSFYLPRRALDSIADLEGVSRIDHFDQDPAVGVHDATVAGLASSLLGSFECPEEANHLFVDHISSAAAAHVLCAYGVGRKLSKQLSTALAPWQEQRAKEILMAHLGGDISVARLAQECGLSITGFNRGFVRATGLTPHQWLLEQRIHKAMTLLRGSNMAVSEVASACGFAHKQSFVRIFTRTVGTDPRAWQRAIKH